MRLSLLLALIVAGALLGAAGCTAWRIGDARELARESTPLQHTPADATLRMLIVGDSTGVGTGASAPRASLAGLLARDHPRLWIENRARDGATFAGTADQLARDGRFDIVLVLAGGNDVKTCTVFQRPRLNSHSVNSPPPSPRRTRPRTRRCAQPSGSASAQASGIWISQKNTRLIQVGVIGVAGAVEGLHRHHPPAVDEIRVRQDAQPFAADGDDPASSVNRPMRRRRARRRTPPTPTA
jgi:hypothetical protein